MIGGEKTTEEKEKEIFKILDRAIAEFRIAIENKEISQKCPRAKFILSFSFAEVMAWYWVLFLGKGDTVNTPTLRFSCWFDEFSKRTTYSKVSLIGSTRLFSLRNNLSHFFGIPEDARLILVSDGVSEAQRFSMRSRIPANTEMLSPGQMFACFKEMAVKMLEEIHQAKKKTSIEEVRVYRAAIERLYLKCESEGAIITDGSGVRI